MPFKHFNRTLLFRLLTPFLAVGTTTLIYHLPARAVTFNFNFSEGTSSDVINGVEQAGLLWGSRLHDDVTVNVAFEFGVLPEGYLGGARPDMVKVNYADAVNQFELDQSSTDDQSAFKNLPTYESEDGNLSISRKINLTKDWWGFEHTDNSTENLWLTRANAKSLGIIAGDDTAVDAAIRLNSLMNWDFEASDGVGGGQYDFMGTVLHELGHSLGFLSGVDVLDYNTRERNFLRDEDYDFVTSMDLFRQSASTAGKGKIDWTVDEGREYFSINGGEDQIADFANGTSTWRGADNFQVSHFKEGTNSVMSPILYQGSQSSISDIDLQLMDAIGWDVAEGSQVDYPNASVAYTEDGNSFDGALSLGGWSTTSYSYTFWQESGFLASTAGGAVTSQEVPEPSSLLGLGVLVFWGSKRLRKR